MLINVCLIGFMSRVFLKIFCVCVCLYIYIYIYIYIYRERERERERENIRKWCPNLLTRLFHSIPIRHFRNFMN